MKLTIIGCAGSFPGPDSPASSYLITADDDAGRTWNVLLDLGNGAFGALQRIVDPFDLDGVAITHLHPDHFIDMCGLYVYLRYHPEFGHVARQDAAGADGTCPAADGAVHPALDVRGPSATCVRIGQACGIERQQDMVGVFDVSHWVEGEVWTIGPLRITPFRVEHPVEAYALRVDGPSSINRAPVVLTFSGDTDSCAGVVEASRDADLLLIEAAFIEGRDLVRGIHLTGKRAGEVGTESRAKRVLLTHLPAWTPPEVVVAEARQTYAGPVEVVTQGATYTL